MPAPHVESGESVIVFDRAAVAEATKTPKPTATGSVLSAASENFALSTFCAPRSAGPSTGQPYHAAPESASTASLRRTTSCRPRPPVHHLDRESRDGTHAHDLRYCAARVLGFFKFTANTVSRSAYAPTALPCSLCSSRDGRKHASNRVHPTGKALAAARDAHPSLVIAV